MNRGLIGALLLAAGLVLVQESHFVLLVVGGASFMGGLICIIDERIKAVQR